MNRSLAFDPVRRLLAAAMKRARVSPQDLERHAGLSTGHVSRILDGRIKSCDLVTVCVLEEALGLPQGKLIPRDEIVELYRESLKIPAAKRRA